MNTFHPSGPRRSYLTICIIMLVASLFFIFFIGRSLVQTTRHYQSTCYTTTVLDHRNH